MKILYEVQLVYFGATPGVGEEWGGRRRDSKKPVRKPDELELFSGV